MAYGIQIEVWGERALFTRPELSVERVSYDVITPSAARGLIESIYWHPGMRYTIDRIHVLNPIRFTNVRRNEVKSKALASSIRSVMTHGGELPYINTKEDIQQRASLILTDVRYVIEAHFELTEGNATQPRTSELVSSQLTSRHVTETLPRGAMQIPASVISA